MGLEILIGVKVVWRVEDVIKGGMRVLKNGGEEFSCKCEATIMKPVSAHKLGAGLVLNAPVTVRSTEFWIGSKSFSWEEGASP